MKYVRPDADRAADAPDVHLVPPDLAPVHRHRAPGPVSEGGVTPGRLRGGGHGPGGGWWWAASPPSSCSSSPWPPALAAFRYLPALDEARALRTDLETMVDRVREAGLGIDRPTMDALDADLAAARGRFGRLESLLADDPLVALARVLPPTAANVRGADDVVAAAGSLLDAVGDGLVIGRRFVEIREAQAADPAGASALSQLVELMATSRDSAVSAAASVASARQTLAAVPDGLVGQVESVRDAMTDADRHVRPAARHVRGGQRAAAGHPGLGRAAALPGPDPGSGRAAADRRVHRQLRDHRLRPGADHRAPLPGRLPARLPVGLPVHRAAAGARGLPARPEAAVAVRRRELVAGLPDERPGRAPPVHERVRRHARSTACSGSPRTRSTSC